MLQNSLFSALSRPTFLLTLLLVVFFSKGAFLVVLQPIFTGQDEARHYNSVQLITEPKDLVKKQNITPTIGEQAKDDLSTYRFSEEIRRTATATESQLLRADVFNTIRFSNSDRGLHESEIDSNSWSRVNYADEKYSPDAVRNTVLYHKLVSVIERAFSNESILVRFYLIRLFSVSLGTLAVLLTYLTARTVGFSWITSLIVTTLIAFQPKFTLYLTNINYDVLLIPMFFLFTYAGVRTIRDGLNLPTLLLFGTSIGIAVFTKGTGYLLIVAAFALFVPFVYQHITRLQNKWLRHTLYTLGLLIPLIAISLLYFQFFESEFTLAQKAATLPTYLSKTLTFNKVIWPSETYWGMLGWTESFVITYATSFIFIVELMATLGLILLLFSKRLTASYPSFLPPKKQIVFLILMIGILQFGVRFADWNVYVGLGGKMSMSLGTPGRYFLPTLLPHILLLVTGLGALLAYFKRATWFAPLLCLVLIFMMSFMLYTIFGILIPRYYF